MNVMQKSKVKDVLNLTHNIFSTLSLFDGTHTYDELNYTMWDDTQGKEVKLTGNLPKLYENVEILAMYVAMYGYRYLAYDFTETQGIIDSIVDAVKWKYLHMVALWGIQYSPIYNVSENKAENRSNTYGQQSTTNPDFIENVSTISNANVDNSNAEWTVTHSDAGDTVAVETEMTVTDNFDTENPRTNTQYKTTYDDTTVRIDSKNTETGTETHTTTGSAENNVTTSKRTDSAGQTVRKYTGNFVTAEHTDSDTYTVHRSGNIGVTKTTELIESEIALHEKNNIIEKFFRDINKHILLMIF